MMIRQHAQHVFTPTNSLYLISSACLAASALVAKKVQNVLSKPSTPKPKKYHSLKVSRTYLEKRRLDPS